MNDYSALKHFSISQTFLNIVFAITYIENLSYPAIERIVLQYKLPTSHQIKNAH